MCKDMRQELMHAPNISMPSASSSAIDLKNGRRYFIVVSGPALPPSTGGMFGSGSGTRTRTLDDDEDDDDDDDDDDEAAASALALSCNVI